MLVRLRPSTLDRAGWYIYLCKPSWMTVLYALAQLLDGVVAVLTLGTVSPQATITCNEFRAKLAHKMARRNG